MSLLTFSRFSAVLASAALAAGAASAGPGGGHGGGGGHAGGGHAGAAHMGGAHVGGAHYAAPHSNGARYGGGYYGGSRTIIVGGYGYGGLGYGGLGYGGLGYGGLGYSGGYYGGGNYGGGNYGYGNSLSVPVIPGTYYAQYPPQYQSLPVQPLRDPNAEPIPLPLPADSAESSPAKITVITSEGAKVTFEGIESDQTGTRHSFTTKPLSTGGEVRVKVTVDGSTISIGVRGGEKATVDMRK